MEPESWMDSEEWGRECQREAYLLTLPECDDEGDSWDGDLAGLWLGSVVFARRNGEDVTALMAENFLNAHRNFRIFSADGHLWIGRGEAAAKIPLAFMPVIIRVTPTGPRLHVSQDCRWTSVQLKRSTSVSIGAQMDARAS